MSGKYINTIVANKGYLTGTDIISSIQLVSNVFFRKKAFHLSDTFAKSYFCPTSGYQLSFLSLYKNLPQILELQQQLLAKQKEFTRGLRNKMPHEALKALHEEIKGSISKSWLYEAFKSKGQSLPIL
jgi:hypothetical protein